MRPIWFSVAYVAEDMAMLEVVVTVELAGHALRVEFIAVDTPIGVNIFNTYGIQL